MPFSKPYLSLCWYCTSLTTAISLRSSTRSSLRDRRYSLLPLRNRSVLNVGKPIYVGMTASVPYLIENGVSLIDFLGVVWYVHKMWCSLSTHFPFASSSLFFKTSMMTLFVASAWPLLWGYDRVECLFFIPNTQQYLQKVLLSNWSPLSEMRVFGTPNLVTIFRHMNLFTSWSRMFARGSASTHLVK